MLIETGEKDSRYTYGQLNADTRLAYYKEVIRYLSGMSVGEKYEEDLTIQECRIAIDNLLEDY